MKGHDFKKVILSDVLMQICVLFLDDLDELTCRQVDAYIALSPRLLVVNMYGLRAVARATLQAHFREGQVVVLREFDPSSSALVSRALENFGSCFDLIICPPETTGIDEPLLDRILTPPALRGVLPARIGCPNDATRHLDGIKDYATRNGIAIINTPNVHANAVAEYTLGQMLFFARRLDVFHAVTGEKGSWPHAEAIRTTRQIAERTLGVIGGAGKDGSAVMRLGLQLGMKVFGLSRSLEGRSKISQLGAEAVPDLDGLLSTSDFLSINCRREGSEDIIGKREIDRMVRGVIIVNPAGGDIFNRDALITELSRADCRIGKLILDMPCGGRRDETAFSADPVNADLKALGVLFTPRMAGYTADASLQATHDLVERLGELSTQPELVVPGIKPDRSKFAADIRRLAVAAAFRSIRMRKLGLAVTYKKDGSPSTTADIEAERVIREGIREAGHDFVFTGEEFQESPREDCNCELIVDAIDGTRNFIDGNYGWCVSIAVREHGEIVVAVVYDPCCRMMYSAIRGQGAFLGFGRPMERFRVPSRLGAGFSFSVGSFRSVVSVTVKHTLIDAIKRLGGRERAWGSVALSICGVARGGLGVYIQGSSHLHDHVAARLIAEEAGAIVVSTPRSVDIEDVVAAHPSIASSVTTVFADLVSTE